ncbi:hypothetical protein BZG36_05362 [Bifiguratus adelaidae]|uniref:Uncharacterized protein n=1 Tax=Bifiguratus adelaidae TaxID=1938954 RepID=A0A261XU70_9FUNG|nr:hypothetical protein BZG36_05362 [Bifiguratus adelaidae]
MKVLPILFGIFLGAKALRLRDARTYDFAPYTASERLDGKIAGLYNPDSQTIIGTNNASGESFYWSSSFLTGSNKHQYFVISHTLAEDFQPYYFRGSILDISQPEFYWQRLIYLNDSASYPQLFNVSGPGYGFEALSTDQVSKLRTWFTNPDVAVHTTQLANQLAYPEHKYKMPEMTQQRGTLTTMNGDRVNDAPSLKKADCGIAAEGASEAAIDCRYGLSSAWSQYHHRLGQSDRSSLQTDISASFVKHFRSAETDDVKPIEPRVVIVNISSLLAVKPFKNWGLHTAGKAARDTFLQIMALEEIDGHNDIKTLSYAPGPLEGDMQQEVCESIGDEDQRHYYAQQHAEANW